MSMRGIINYPQHYEFKTRWKDIDLFGHVNNAVFLTYIEDARIIYFKKWSIIHCIFIDFKKGLLCSRILSATTLIHKTRETRTTPGKRLIHHFPDSK